MLKKTSSGFIKHIAFIFLISAILSFTYAAKALADKTKTQTSSSDTKVTNDGEKRARNAGLSLLGKAGPAVTLTTIDGEKIDLANSYGKKPVYLKFWATWCVPCREQMPHFEKIFQTYGDKMQVVAINTGFSDNLESVNAFRKKLGIHMPIVIDDGSLASYFNLRVTPQHILIGRDGRIAYVGHLADQQFEAALQRVLNTEKIDFTPPAKSTATNEKVFKVGDLVTNLSAQTIANKKIMIDGKNEKPRALVFFASWCESYLAESRPETSKACQRVRENTEKLAERGDIEWLNIASGLWTTPADVKDYIATMKPIIQIALDESGELFRAFNIRQIPTIVLIDKAGKVQRILGPQDTDLENAIKALNAP